MIAEISALTDVGVTYMTSDLIATRGEHLAPQSCPVLGSRSATRRFHTDDLDILEIDADERVTARVVFDLDDIDAAFAELDARYLAGEAAAHAHTWSVIAQAYAATQPARTPRDDAGLGRCRPSPLEHVRAR